MIMVKKDLDFFRNRLSQWLQELLDHADDTLENLLEPEEHLADPLDRASFESNRLTGVQSFVSATEKAC
jgi:RNA polymerase-binding transcription factor DksA